MTESRAVGYMCLDFWVLLGSSKHCSDLLLSTYHNLDWAARCIFQCIWGETLWGRTSIIAQYQLILFNRSCPDKFLIFNQLEWISCTIHEHHNWGQAESVFHACCSTSHSQEPACKEDWSQLEPQDSWQASRVSTLLEHARLPGTGHCAEHYPRCHPLWPTQISSSINVLECRPTPKCKFTVMIAQTAALFVKLQWTCRVLTPDHYKMGIGEWGLAKCSCQMP